jgi:hypothetical protein
MARRTRVRATAAWLAACVVLAACGDKQPTSNDETEAAASEEGEQKRKPKRAPATSAAAASASATAAPTAPTWTVPRTPSDMPTEADWDAAKTGVETSSDDPAKLCSMRLIREWAAIRCKTSVSLITEQQDLGKAGTDYVVGTASGGTTFIRLRPGVAGYAKFASEGDDTAHFSYAWAESQPAPTYLVMSAKNRHHEVLNRADQKPVDEVPAFAAPLAARPKPGDWSMATRLSGGAKAPSDCALLALGDWLRVHCKRPLSNTEFEQYAFFPGEGLGEKGKDYLAEMKGLVGTEMVIELRMQKGTQTAKIRVNPVTGSQHTLTVEWPEGAAKPEKVVLEGKR